MRHRHLSFSAAALAVAAVVAGCGQTTPPSPAPPSPTAAVAGGPLCASGPPDAPDQAAIAALRAKYPKLTDDRAAYAMSLLPPEIASSAGVTSVVSGTPSDKLMASFDAGVLTIRSGSDVAPAEMASSIVFLLTTKVFGESNKTPTVSDLQRIASGVAAVTADTYLRLAQTRPSSTRGSHATAESHVEQARKRLARDPGMLIGLNQDSFSSHPAYWDALSSFMGTEYYRPGTAGLLHLAPPVKPADAAALSERLRPCS